MRKGILNGLVALTFVAGSFGCGSLTDKKDGAVELRNCDGYKIQKLEVKDPERYKIQKLEVKGTYSGVMVGPKD